MSPFGIFEAFDMIGIVVLCFLVFPICFLVGMCSSAIFVSLFEPIFGPQITLYVLARFWAITSRLYNGHEIRGIQNIPTNQSAILVYYHGTLPIDIHYVIAKLAILGKNIKFALVTDRFLFKIPLLRSLLALFDTIPAGNEIGLVERCKNTLTTPNSPRLLAIAPGGVREAQFASSDTYDILWSMRKGYAKLSVQTKCPIVVAFTKNCREVARCPKFLVRSNFVRAIYERTRLPIIPIFGLFPVKMITFLSEPMFPADFDFDETKVDLAVRQKMKEMISNHQTHIPGNVFYAMLERLK